MKTDDETLIAAMENLAHNIQSEDGIANAAIAEAAVRLAELRKALIEIRDSPYNSCESESPTSYVSGVVAGHRFCAKIARKVLNQQ